MFAFSLALRRAARRTLQASSLTLAVSLVTAQANAQEAGIAIGAHAPSAAVETLDGKAMDLSRYIGKTPMVLEFWATWCPLCKKLEPAMSAAREKYGKDVAFVSVGVPQNQTAERQRTYVTEKQMKGEFVFDKDGAAYKAYKATHTSYVVVVDANGMVAYTGVGPEQDIDAAVKKVLPANKRSM